MQRAVRSRRRRRLTVVCAAAAAAAVLAACGGPPTPAPVPGAPVPGAPVRTVPPVSTPATPVTPATLPNGPAPGAIGTFSVRTVSLDLSEPTTAGGERSLPTTVWYPASTAGAAPQRFALLLFSQGFDLAVAAYSDLITQWASAGYVVAAPTYPATDPSDPNLDESDIVNHPADAAFVITSVLDLAGRPGSPLSGLVDPDEIGVVGHSDGGEVSLALAADSCCRDERVRAAVILSGAELGDFGGTYFTAPAAPLLAVQGDADAVNPAGCSAQFYDDAPAPKYYLDLLGADHEQPYTDPGAADDAVVATVTTEFFDAELYGQSGALSAMAGAGQSAGVSSLLDGGTAPADPTDCT